MKNLIKTLAITAIIATTATAQWFQIWDGTFWDGTANTEWYNPDPVVTSFLITTAEELAGLAQLVNSGVSFAGRTINLAKHIALNNAYNWENWSATIAPANSWTPIGNQNNPFRGRFNGNGFLVAGMYISNNINNQGLFGHTSGSTIENIGVVYSYVRGGSNVGGLVGENRDGMIRNCYAHVNIVGASIVGALIGQNLITNQIINCYATGSVSLTTPGHSGGLIATHTGHPIPTCYFDTRMQIPGGGLGTGDWNGTRVTTEQMMQRSTFVGWDFDNIWYIEEGLSYPQFRNQNLSIITLPQYVFVYTGEPILVPSPVEFWDRGQRFSLTENVDYTTSYSNNVNTGTATVVLRGIGDYSFEIAKQFRIDRRNVSVERWENTTLQWHGAPQAPTPISSDPNFPLTVTPQSFHTVRNASVSIPSYTATATIANPIMV